LHCYIGALERIDELYATIAVASRRVVESSVAVVANDSGVASLQRLSLGLTRAIRVATKARILIARVTP